MLPDLDLSPHRVRLVPKDADALGFETFEAASGGQISVQPPQRVKDAASGGSEIRLHGRIQYAA